MGEHLGTTGGFADAKAADSLLFDVVEARQLHAEVRSRIFGEADPVRIGRYTVLERLGEGGMGVVYAAFDNKLDRKVAVKLMRRRDAASHERLLREAKAMARLSHPNVVQVHDVGEWRGRVFIAMEFVRGVTLGQWRTQVTDFDRFLDALMQAGAGLAAAHDAGVVHRDFKPDNVLVAEDGRVRVLDFGIARTELTERVPTHDTARVELDLTATGTVLGTPAYMAPEQFLGESVDSRADQWAFGVVLYEALLGERPFVGRDFAALRTAVLQAAPSSAGKLPSRVARVVARTLQRDPDARYPSMVALMLDLRPPVRARMLGPVGLGALAVVLLGSGMAMREAFRDDAASSQEVARAAVQVEQTQHELTSQSDELAIERAREALDDDPVEALDALAKVSPAGWNDDARCLLTELQARGIPAEITEGHGWATRPEVVDGMMFRRRGTDAMFVIDPNTLEEHQLPVASAHVVGDGSALAYCGTTTLWIGAADGTELASLPLPEDFSTYVVAPNAHAVMITTEREAMVYTLPASPDDEPLRFPLLGLAPYSVMAVAPDGHALYALEGETLLRLDGDGRHELATGVRGNVKLSRDGAWLSADLDDVSVRVWSSTGNEALTQLYVRVLALSPVGGWSAMLHEEGESDRVTADRLGEKRRRKWDAPPWTVDALRFSDDGQWLVGAGAGKLRVWNVATGMAFEPTWEHALLAWSIDSRGMLTVADGRGARIRWDLQRAGLQSTRAHEQVVTYLRYEGDVLYSGGNDVHRWDPGVPTSVAITGDVGPVNDVAIEGDAIGVGLRGGGTVFFEGGKEIVRTASMAFSSSVVLDPVAMIYARLTHGTLERIDGAVPEQRRLHVCEEDCGSPSSLAEAGQYRFPVMRGGPTVVIRTGGKTQWWRDGDAEPHDVDLAGAVYPSSDGTSIADVGWDGRVRVIDLESDEPSRVGLGFAPEGLLYHGRPGSLLLETNDGMLAWWPAGLSRPCGIGLPMAGIVTAAVSDDEHELAFGLDDGSVARMPMPSALTVDDPVALVEELRPERLGER